MGGESQLGMWLCNCKIQTVGEMLTKPLTESQVGVACVGGYVCVWGCDGGVGVLCGWVGFVSRSANRSKPSHQAPHGKPGGCGVCGWMGRGVCGWERGVWCSSVGVLCGCVGGWVGVYVGECRCGCYVGVVGGVDGWVRVTAQQIQTLVETLTKPSHKVRWVWHVCGVCVWGVWVWGWVPVRDVPLN